MKPLAMLSLGVHAIALLVSLGAAPARAQGFQIPGGNPALCEQMAQMARNAPGVDLGAFAAMAGCKPKAAAPKPTAIEATCTSLASMLEGSRGGDVGFWLGPLPVLMARELALQCFDQNEPSAVQERLREGLRRFGAGRFAASVDAFREGLTQVDSDSTRTRLMAEMGKSQLAAGQTDEARRTIEQALRLAEKTAAPTADARRAERPANIANLQQAMEQAMQANRERAAADSAYQVQAELLVLAGLVQLQANDLPGAIGRLRDANALVERQGRDVGHVRSIVAPYLALALQRVGRLDEARTLLEGAMAGREESLGALSAAPQMMEALKSVGMAGLMAGQERNMNAGAMMSGELFLPSFACPLLEQIEVQGPAPERALEAAERCRGRALAQLLANRAFNKPLRLLREPEATQRRAGAQRDRPRTADESRRDFMDNPAAEAASQPATMADMRRMAAERNATLVVYSVSYSVNQLPNRMPDRETGIRMWVVGPDGRVTMRQRGFEGVLDNPHDTYALTTAVLRSREALGVTGRGPIAAVPAPPPPRVANAGNELRRLHQLLIAPVADLLPRQEGARVLVVPHGALFLVPFAALEDAAGAPLVARYALSVSPSMQTLALTATRKQASNVTGPALIVGNPVMPRYSAGPGKPSYDMPALPGAEEEAKAIGNLLKVSPLIGAAATKPAVIRAAQNARYIHLATHGLLDDLTDRAQRDANPWVRKVSMMGQGVVDMGDSRTPGLLALAPSGNDGGMLGADEIADSTTRAELVVMSACDSGRGAINDEGVIGLSRAWMAAGAPSVIVTLWAIPDEPTRDLMVDFYGRLAKGSGKAEALREAMLATRAKYRNPAHWAAFVLLGEPG